MPVQLFSLIHFIFLFCVILFPKNLHAQTARQAYQDAIRHYYTAGKTGPADTAFLDFLASYHDVASARMDLIQIYREEAKLKEALVFMKTLSETYPDINDYKNMVFVLAVQGGDYSFAKKIEPMIGDDGQTIFYRGFLRYQMRQYNDAVPYFQRALQFKNNKPQAYHFLGMCYLQQKFYNLAIENFVLALKEEPSFMLSLEPLGKSYLAVGNWRKALSTLRRAQSNLPEKKSVSKAVKDITGKYEKELEQETLSRQNRKTVFNAPVLTTFPKIPGRPVRIGLSERMSTIYLKPGADYRISFNGEISQGKKGDIIHIHSSWEKSESPIANKSYMLKNKDTLSISYSSNNASTVVFDLVDGQGYFFVRTADRAYRGNMEVLGFSRGMTLVNILPMESYLYSVVPSEIPSYWPMEALKAQAVAARTYTLVNMGRFSHRGFDLYGSITSHAYTGIGGENPRTTQAVNDTAGLVLYTNANKKDLLATYYSANTGGFTDSETVVWNKEGPGDHVGRPDKLEKSRPLYLPPAELAAWIKSRPKTYSSWPNMHFAPAFRSVVWISAEEMALRVGRSKKIGNIRQFQVLERSISGRVTQVKAIGDSGAVVISGDMIRNRLGGLRSNLYSMQTITNAQGKPIYFIIYTAGWGHGIGMDQSGAAGMAADGHTFRNILSHYYPRGYLSAYSGSGR